MGSEWKRKVGILLLIWNIFSFFMCCITNLRADTGLDFSNDVLWPPHSDRWYSNGVRLYHGDYALGMEMLTPKDKRNPGIPVNDRPWDGYLYGEYTFNLKEERTIKLRGGCLGACSYQEQLQKFVHNDLGLGIDPKGWHTMNPSEPTLELLYEHPFIHVFDSWLGVVRAETVYGFRVGNVQDLAFLETEITKGLLRQNYSIYGIAGIRGEARAFNTHLQGRMLHDDTYTVDMIPFVASTWLGFGATYGKWCLEFVYTYVTDETRLQDYERHLYGTVTIKRTM